MIIRANLNGSGGEGLVLNKKKNGELAVATVLPRLWPSSARGSDAHRAANEEHEKEEEDEEDEAGKRTRGEGRRETATNDQYSVTKGQSEFVSLFM